MGSTILFFVFWGTIHLTSPAWGVTFEESVPPGVARDILTDLEFVSRIGGAKASPLHRSVFGPLSGRHYLKWLDERIAQIGYAPLSGRGMTAYNDSSAERPNHVVVTDWFARGDLPQIARVSVLFHEARHSEQLYEYWPHQKCPTPFRDQAGQEIKSAYTGLALAGAYACDSTALGAYGISVIMLMNIAHSCRGCNEKIRQDAAFYGADQLQRLTIPAARRRLASDLQDRHGKSQRTSEN